MTFRVDSEMGQLRQAIVHRPGLELSRLTPGNIGSLLFDDVLWAPKAKEEHDAFAEALRDKGVLVHYYGQLLAEALEVAEGRAFVLDRVCTPEVLGPQLAGPVRRLFEDLDGSKLAASLVGGVLKADLHPHRTHSLKWEMLRADDFILPPLPNTLFTRDNSCWMYGGLTVNPMAMPAAGGKPCTAGPSTASTRCSPTPTSSPTTGARTATTSRPPSRAATSMSSATGPS